jgi:cysteine desulfurase
LKFIYADNSATTRVSQDAEKAMLPFLRQRWANAGSAHAFGSELTSEIKQARENVAALIGADSSEICFTSGGTEANNLAIRGILDRGERGKHIITSVVEHPSVYRVIASYLKKGYDVTEVPVDSEGRLDIKDVEIAIRPDTTLIAIMGANNETGVLMPVEEIANIAAENGIPFLCDAIQMWGKVPFQVGPLGPNLVSFSAHKFHGPKGMGALYIRQRTRILPQMLGGGQENGWRSGTENVPGIVGMGVAAREAAGNLAHGKRIEKMRDRLQAGLLEIDDRIVINGAKAKRLPGTLCVCITGIESGALVNLLSEKGICVSGGSACTAGHTDPSHVLMSMGRTPEEALGAMRFSFSRENSEEDVDAILNALPPLLKQLRSVSEF